MRNAKHTFTTIAIAAGVALGGAAIAAGNANLSESERTDGTTVGAIQDESVRNDAALNSQPNDTSTMGAGPSSDTMSDSNATTDTSELGAGPSTMDAGAEGSTMRAPRLDRN